MSRNSRVDWKKKAELQITYRVLSGDCVALFLFQGKRLAFMKPNSIRTRVLMERVETHICVFVGMYDLAVMSVQDVMDDVLFAHRRSESLRVSLFFKRKRLKKKGVIDA